MYSEELQSIIGYLESYPAVVKISINTEDYKIGLKISNDGGTERKYFQYDPKDLFPASQEIMKFLEDRYDE